MAATSSPVRRAPDADRHGVVGVLRDVVDTLGLHRSAVPAFPTMALPGRDAPALVIGRSRRCDVVLGDVSVSRTHATLMLYAGQWFLTDRGSTNGTYVNGRQVWGATEVRPGDRVRFGSATYVLTRAPDRPALE